MLSFFHIMSMFNENNFLVKYFPEKKKFTFKNKTVVGEVSISSTETMKIHVESECDPDINLEISENDSIKILDKVIEFQRSCFDLEYV